MSAIIEAANKLFSRRARALLEWDGAAPSVRLFVLGTELEMDPDEARALGLALVEASGLALGAWGQRQSDRADDAETAHAEEKIEVRAAIKAALGRHQRAPDMTEGEG